MAAFLTGQAPSNSRARSANLEGPWDVVGLVKLFRRDHSNERLMSRVKLADRPLKSSGLMNDVSGQIFDQID
jgi:hypothetical protein